jgi:hypothetical protein
MLFSSLSPVNDPIAIGNTTVCCSPSSSLKVQVKLNLPLRPVVISISHCFPSCLRIVATAALSIENVTFVPFALYL